MPLSKRTYRIFSKEGREIASGYWGKYLRSLEAEGFIVIRSIC